MVSKKEKRKIVVENKEYWWQVHYDKDFLRPYIFISTDKDKLLIKESFDKERIISPEYIKNLINKNSL